MVEVVVTQTPFQVKDVKSQNRSEIRSRSCTGFAGITEAETAEEPARTESEKRMERSIVGKGSKGAKARTTRG